MYRFTDLNLVDWSSLNILAVALGNSVYLWNADSGGIDHLLELEGADYVCSVSWMSEGNLLAVGTSLGNVQVSLCSERMKIVFDLVYIFLRKNLLAMGREPIEETTCNGRAFCSS